ERLRIDGGRATFEREQRHGTTLPMPSRPCAADDRSEPDGNRRGPDVVVLAMGRSGVRRAALVLAMVGGLVLAGCGADDVPMSTGGTGTPEVSTRVTTVPEPIPDGADGLDLARRRWADSGIEDYTMSYREICFCPGTTVTVEGRDGSVVDTTVAQDPAVRAPDGGGVDDFFAELQA